MGARTYDFHDPRSSAQPQPQQPERRGLVGLLVLLAAGGALLFLLGGPPHLPVRPDPRTILGALRAPDPPLRGAASWCFALGWALWLWTAASLLVQGALAALELATHGAAWARALRPALAPLLMPLARRAFPVVAAATIAVRVATAPAPGAAAPAPIVLVHGAVEAPTGADLNASPRPWDAMPSAREHVVVAGDTLRGLAARYYGTGDEFARLHEANLGRPMPDGTRYLGRLRPGQVLRVPPASLVTERVGGQTVYTVEEGDTLRGIAARFLGDEMRWPEIFNANKGTARLPDGRTLTDPDLIWPGLRLVIPIDETAPTPPAPPAPAVPTPPSAPVAPRTPTVPASPAPSAPPTQTAPPPVATPAPTAAATRAPAPAPTPGASIATPARPTPSPRPRPVPTSAAGGAASGVPARPGITSGHASPGRAPLVYGAGTASLLVLGGAAFLRRRELLARRELRRRMRAAVSPASFGGGRDAAERADFADAGEIETFTHRAHGGEVEPAVALAHHTARFCAEQGLADATVLLAVQEGHGDATLLLDVPIAGRERLTALAPALGTLLGGKARAVPVDATGDVQLRFTGLTAAGLLAPLVGRSGQAAPTLLPLVAMPGTAPLFANWDALGHVLVAGGPGEGIDTVLAALAATLASRRHPDTLRLWAIAQQEVLPPELFLLPHWGDPRVDPRDITHVGGLLRELRAELERRQREPPDTPRPDLVLVLSELADLDTRGSGDTLGTTLEILAADGPACGIRLVAATARPDRLDEGLLRHFATRLVLRLEDEAQSMRLLGVPDAAGLEGTGRLLVRLAGRPPRPLVGVATAQMRGYRITPDALRQLATAMGGTYGLSADTASQPAAHAPAARATAMIAIAERHVVEEEPAEGAEGRQGRDATAQAPSDRAPRNGSSSAMPGDPNLGGATTLTTTTTRGVRESGADRGGAMDDDHTRQLEEAGSLPPAEPYAPHEGPTRPSPLNLPDEGRSRDGDCAAPIVAHSSPGHDRDAPNEPGNESLPVIGTALPAAQTRAAGHEPGAGDTLAEGRLAQGEASEAQSAPGGQQDLGGSPNGPTSNGATPVSGVVSTVGAAIDSSCAASVPARTPATLAPPAGVSTGPGPSAVDSQPERREPQGPRPLGPGKPALAAVPEMPPRGSAAHVLEPANEPVAAAPLTIRCFGSLQVRHGDAPLAPRRHLKAWELLQALAAHPPRTMTRDKLQLALWPDPEVSLSRNTLNVTVARLREELTAQVPGLPRDVVRQARNGDCWLDPDLVSVDVHEWLAIIDREPKLTLLDALTEYCRAGDLYRPTLLDGAGYEWLYARDEGVDLVESYRSTWRRYVLRLARRCVREDRPDLAVPIYRHLMDDQPRNEVVVRELYRCYGRTGDLRGLEREARALAVALREGYGDDLDGTRQPEIEEPEAETQRVYEEIRQELSARERVPPNGAYESPHRPLAGKRAPSA